MDRGAFRPRLMDAATPEERMTALGDFLEFWIGPRREDFGESEEEVNRHRLPMPLRWLYRFAGNWPDVNGESPSEYVLPALSCEDYLASLPHLTTSEAGRIVFAEENQSTWQCLTLPDGDDPPVWCAGDIITGDGWFTGEKLVSDSLSRFLVTFALRELTYGSKLCVQDEGLAKRFRSGGEAEAIWTDSRFIYGEGPGFYLWGNVLVMDGGGHPLFAANDPGGIDMLEADQGAIRLVSILVHSPWCLDVSADGSANLVYRMEPIREAAEAPSGTFDFPRLVADLRAGISDQGHSERNATVHFFRRGQAGPAKGGHFHDAQFVRNLFLRALASTAERNASLESRLAADPLF